jgi:hypothetical protein
VFRRKPPRIIWPSCSVVNSPDSFVTRPLLCKAPYTGSDPFTSQYATVCPSTSSMRMKRFPVGLFETVQGGDFGMAQGGKLSFALEASQPFGVVGELIK